MSLTRPPTIDDKALAALDGEWRTAREIFGRVDEGAIVTVANALARLTAEGKVERRYDPHNNKTIGKIARYRRLAAALTGQVQKSA